MSFETVRFGVKWKDVTRPQTLTNVHETTLADDIPLSDSVVSLVLQVNAEQYQKLLSSALNGANIYFPDEYLDIIYPLLRAGQMSFCDEVLNCILNSDEIQGAIAGIASGAGGVGASGGDIGAGAFYPIPASVSDDNLLVGATCTDDNLFAIARGIVNFSFDVVGQFFDAIELLSQPFEIQAELADNAPAVATAVPASVLDWGLWIQDTASALWDVYDSPTERDIVACELFCLLKDNACNLTFDDLLAFFAQGSALPIAGNKLQDILADMVLLNSAELIGKTSLAFMYGVLALGSKFGGVPNVGGIMARVWGFLDDTDNAWVGLCADCNPTWEHTFSFLNNTFDGWQAWEGRATTAVSGIASTTNLPDTIQMRITFAETTITYVSFQPRDGFVPNPPLPNARVDFPNINSGTSYTSANGVFDGLNETTTGAWVSVQVGAQSNKLQSLTMRGTGVNPFV